MNALDAWLTRKRSAEAEEGPQGERGPEGPAGPEGPRGPMGPMPDHEWRDDQIRFERELEDGTVVWGQYSEHLRGPRGRGGGGLAGASTVVEGGGFAPTYIAPGETFVVPANRQVLFATQIVCDGILDVAGMLIEVS